jgi:uncharacterized protein (UPF0332 family)
VNINDLFRNNLLKKARISRNEIKGSLKLAKKFLQRAKGNLKIQYFDIAFMLAYTSMFHSARSLLFSFGIKERSHFAMILYLKEKFSGNKEILEFLEVLDSYRIARHSIQYRGNSCSKTDAEEAIKDAMEFLEIVTKYLNVRKS